jgi:MFS family permease
VRKPANEGAASLSVGARGSLPTFRALEHRDFRVVWTGLAVSSVGTWMQIVAQSLLVLDLTHGSSAALGAVSLVQALSFLLFALVGGGVADRFDRRRLLLLTQSLLMGLAVLLGVLTAAGVIRFWMVPLVAFTSSAILSFDQPARNAFVTSLVPKENFMNAVSLQAATFNGASILGPALAGMALGRIGYAGNFFVNAASYSAMLAALMLLHTDSATAATPSRRGLFDAVREALGYVRRDALLPSVVSAYGALLFFGPSAALMLPLFARQVAHVGSTQLGILFSAVGAGTVLGALIVASLGDFPQKKRLGFGSIVFWILALVVFGFSRRMTVAVPALVVLGVGQNTAGAVTITLLQSRVPAEMRGRVMSLNTLLIMCARPLGDFPVAAVIGLLGFRPTILLCATIVGFVLLALSCGVHRTGRSSASGGR